MIFDGHRFADKILFSLKKKISGLEPPPSLLILVAQEDNKGQLYTRLIQKQASSVGIKITLRYYSLKHSCCSPVRNICRLNKSSGRRNDNYYLRFSGILIQKPGRELRQRYFKTEKDFEVWWLTNTSKIPEKKDIDCLNVANLGLLTAGLIQFYPAAVKAIWRILKYALKEFSGNVKSPPRITPGVETSLTPGVGELAATESRLIGKKITILGASEIIGKPLAMLLRNHSGDVTMVAEGTQKHLRPYAKSANIILSCVGEPKLLTADMVKKGSIVIDAGYTIINNQAAGDVDFEAVKKKAAFITPVPGGVGPVTIACLLENAYLAAKRKDK